MSRSGRRKRKRGPCSRNGRSVSVANFSKCPPTPTQPKCSLYLPLQTQGLITNVPLPLPLYTIRGCYTNAPRLPADMVWRFLWCLLRSEEYPLNRVHHRLRLGKATHSPVQQPRHAVIPPKVNNRNAYQGITTRCATNRCRNTPSSSMYQSTSQSFLYRVILLESHSIGTDLRALVIESPASPAISFPLVAAKIDSRVADSTTTLPNSSSRTDSQRSTTCRRRQMEAKLGNI